MPSLPNHPEPFVIAKLRSPARYAIVESVGADKRILCLMDDKADADQMAIELRGKGVMATACRTRVPVR